MGNVASVPPEVAKETDEGDDMRHAFGVSSMQGWREEMEDRNECVLQLGDDDPTAAFAVFDGHFGGFAADFAKQRLLSALVQEESYQKGDYAAALKAAYLTTDAALRVSSPRPSSGTTAIVALLPNDGTVYVANAGDCRAVISKQGKAVDLSREHRPDESPEKERVYKAGGVLDKYGECLQVGDRRLAVSRALGDFEFKTQRNLPPDQQVILACPEIGVFNLKGDEEFLVLATDGIWDTLSSQSVVNYVRLQVSSGTPLAEICELIMEFCLAPEGNYRAGTDNMTCVVVALLAGRTLREWYAWVRERVEQRIGFHTPAAVQRPFDEFEVMRARDAWRAYERRQAKAHGDVWEVSASRGRDDQDGRRKGGGKTN